MIRIIFIALCCAGALMAQGEPERVTVPLHDPSRPAEVRAHLLGGSLTIRGADIRDVEVEGRSHVGGPLRPPEPPEVQGMHRLGGGNAGLDVVEDNNVVTIKTSPWAASLTITVPRRSSLQLSCVTCQDIDVANVAGEIDASDMNGQITLKNISGPVVAHSLNGQIVATFDRVDPSKPTSFSTMNGNIDVTLPADVKADLRMKTDNGAIYTDFDVKLSSTAHVVQTEPERRHEGNYHVKFDHTLRGTINGGGPELQFTSFNGQIYIRKKK